jgi:hypothetical protein
MKRSEFIEASGRDGCKEYVSRDVQSSLCSAAVQLAKSGHDPHSSKLFVFFSNFVLFYVFVLCRSVYCLCVNVYCTTATGWQPTCS